MLVAGGVFVFSRGVFNAKPVEQKTDLAMSAENFNVDQRDQLVYKNEAIPLLWADNNDGEDLIIKSDRQYYDASEQTEVFFSVGNQTSSDQKTDIYFWFDGADKTIASAEGLSSGGRRQQLKIENCKLNENCKLEIKNLSRKDVKGYTQGSKFQDTISANQTSYYRAAVKFPKGAGGEFFIEAFGGSSGCRNIYGYADEQISSDCDVIAYGHLDPYYASGLVGMWSFNGQDTNWTSATAGTTNDLSGNGNTGTMTNMSRGSSPVPGISGQALTFDGVDDYVNIAADSSINDMATATISMWFKVKALTTTGSFLIKDPGDTSALNIYPYSDRRLQLTRKYSGDDLYIICTASSFALNEWTHVAVAFAGMNGSDGHIYFNGVECGYDARSSATGALLSDAAGPLRIISSQQAGSFDEVRVYNRALSAGEIVDLYRLGAARMKVNTPITKAGPQSGLVGNWTFNGQDINWSSNTAYDRSGSGNNGAITNMSTSTSPVPGISGQALNFDGTDDAVWTTNSYSNPQDFTISAWFKTTIASGNAIVNFAEYISNPSGATDRTLYMGTDGNIHFFWWSGLANRIDSLTTLNDGNWHHAVGTHTSSNSGSLYIDGALQGTGDNAAENRAGYWMIGAGNCGVATYFCSGTDYYFPGLIDEVRVYNRALSTGEIVELYKDGARRVKIRQ